MSVVSVEFVYRSFQADWQESEEMAEVVDLVTTPPDFVHSLSCIEEEGNESPGSNISGEGTCGTGEVPSVSVEEPLDEKLFRLQSRVISMLEMQKRRAEPKEPLRARKAAAPRGPGAVGTTGAKLEAERAKAKSSYREVKENQEKVEKNEDWRNTPGGAVQHRKNLAKHYKEQLELLEHEEKELQHQMNLRQQLRLVLHDEAQQCERACLEPESELAAHNAHEKEHATEQLVEENRQLDLLRRQLEEQLRISEERRLQLEQENQLLQKRPKQRPPDPVANCQPNGVGSPPDRSDRHPAGNRVGKASAAPAAPASLRTKSPRWEA